MMPFSTLLTSLTPVGEGWTVDPSDDWRQGRTLFGGASAALCYAACEAMTPTLPPLRSAQIAYIGPSAGSIALRPMLLRSGKSVTFMACDLVADGALAARALFAFGDARDAEPHPDALAMPAVDPPQQCPPLWNVSRPAFTAHFDQRLAGGAPPMAGAERGELLVWAKHGDAGSASPLAALVAIGDALPPAAMSRVATPTIISTMSWHLDLLAPDAFDAGDFVLLHSVEQAAAAGYSGQDMQIWARDGRLIALGRQNVTIFPMRA